MVTFTVAGPDAVYPSVDKSMTKLELRRHFITLRQALSAEWVAASSAALCERLAAWPVLHQVHTVLAYLAFRHEPDLKPLFDMLEQVQWVLPRIEGQRLRLHPYDPAHLVRHRFGMLEPAADLPLVDPAAIDLALVPGVSFDRQGVRLGFGGGYYDRFLPTTPAVRVGVCFDCCLIDALPRDPHDQRMDWVATEAQILRIVPEG